MLSKLFPRKLNHSADSKLRKKDDMSDAVNISVEGDDRGEDGGNENVIKPVKSNTALFGDILSSTNKTVLGKVTDDKYNVVYFFVWDATSDFSGVYAYDPDLYFSGHGADDILKIYTSSNFNFQVDSFVNAEITYIQKQQSLLQNGEDANSSGYEDTPILFFTDNRNEPRKLNVLRAYYNDGNVSNSYGTENIEDFITACPKAPVHPITFSWSSDLELPVSEFRGVNGFQFAYQSVFKDGNVSAISTYSEIAVPPSYINQGTDSSANLLAHNVCDLVVPSIDFTLEVDKVKVLARRGNTGSWFEITELENEDFNSDLTYSFNNTSVNIAVSKDDQIKQFDNLPKKAETQAIEGNRVFYGNYVEGFDDVPTDATITPVNKARPQDFISYNLELKPATCHSESVFQFNGSDAPEVSSVSVKNKNSAFVIDTAQLPATQSIQQNDQFTLTFSILPDNNWHIYDAKDAYHQHNQLGNFWENDPNFGSDGSSGSLQDYYWQNSVDSGQDNIADNIDAFDDGGGNFIPAQVKSGVVNSESNDTVNNNTFEWNYVTGDAGSTSAPTRFGTSAANPLIVQAKPVSISITLRADDTGVTREDVSIAATEAITQGLNNGAATSNNFTVISSDLATTYSYNLGLNNGSTFSMTDPLAKLIVMTGDRGFEGGPLHGNFILNSATVDLGFFEDRAYTHNTNQDQSTDNYYFGEGIFQGEDFESTDDRRIGIYIKKIYNVNALTCLRAGRPNSPWHVYGPDNILNVNPSEDLSEGPFEPDFGYPELATPFDSGGAFEKNVGKLTYTDTTDNPFFKGENNQSQSCFTVLDGKGGIAGGPASLSGELDYDNATVLLGPNDPVLGITNLGSAPMQVSGQAEGSIFSGPVIDNNARFFMPLHDGSGIADPIADGSSIDISLQHSASLILGDSFFITSSQGDGERSFKSGANHAFGVVYYDARGRASSVYPIGTAYAPAYYNRVDNNYGRIEMQITLLHDAPDWAKDFQIVYSGNTSVSDFTQYTTGGAFYVESEDVAGDGNIYVSLNYLQENNDVSYTEAFGARSPEGAADMYTFKEGDLLRVISYYSSEDNRVFVNNRFLFEVAGQRTLSSGEDNPLFDINEDGDAAHPSKEGNFIILKNKPDADGFAFYDVQLGDNGPNSPTHNWNKRCVVEIISPSDSQSEDNIVYYETSKVFPITNHASSITIANGDVWWRRVPVNMPKFENGVFKNIVLEQGSQPRFAPYYLETKAFNDTVRNADVTGQGKLKIVLPDAQESRRSTSITYSEKNNPASSVFQLTSFNPAKLQFKDLPIEHGNINYLLAQQDSLFVIQANRCASVPVDRNIITTASNDQSLVAASKVLGTQRYYAGKYGCDNNPESVCAVGSNVYFASKSNAQVYRFNPSNGIEVISDKGMKSFFRKTFRSVILNQSDLGLARIVGGYDPAKDEYIISIYNQSLASFEVAGSGTAGTATSNALEFQLYTFIQQTLQVQMGSGPAFDINDFPDHIKNFYNGYSENHNLDDSHLLDVDGDGVFTTSDVNAAYMQGVLGGPSIRSALQAGANRAIIRIQNSTLAPILGAITSDPTGDGDSVSTPFEIRDYILSKQNTIATQKITITDLQTELYGGEGYSREDPSAGSAFGTINFLVGQVEFFSNESENFEAQVGVLNEALEAAAASEVSTTETILGLNQQIDSLTSSLNEFTAYGFTAEEIGTKLGQLQAIENALTSSGFEGGVDTVQTIITNYAAYSNIGSPASFQNAINTLQALENVGVDMSEVYNLTTTAVFSSEFIEGVLSDGIADSNLETALSSELYQVLYNAGYSQNVAGLNALVADLDQWQNIGTAAGFGTNLSYNEVLDNLIKFNDFNQLGYNAAQLGDIIDAYNDYTDTGLSPNEVQGFVDLNLSPEEINDIVAELDSYTDVGTVDQFEAFAELEEQYGSLNVALGNLQSYLDINPDWTTHGQAQSALQDAYTGWSEWETVSQAGFSSSDVVSVLADYNILAGLGFDVAGAGGGGIFASEIVTDLQGEVADAAAAQADAVAAQAGAEADLAAAIIAQGDAEGLTALALAAEEAAADAQLAAELAADAALELQQTAEGLLATATTAATNNLDAFNSFASNLTLAETAYGDIGIGIETLANQTNGWGALMLGEVVTTANPNWNTATDGNSPSSNFDTNDDGDIGTADLLEFLANFGEVVDEGSDLELFDTNLDGEIGSADLLDFLIAYGNSETTTTTTLGYDDAMAAAFAEGVATLPNVEALVNAAFAQGLASAPEGVDGAAFTAEILQLQTDLVSVGLSLGAHGWSPINNLANLNPASASDDVITPEQSVLLGPAVNAALTQLQFWTNAFQGHAGQNQGSFSSEGGGEEYFRYNTGLQDDSLNGNYGSGFAENNLSAGQLPASWSDIISGSSDGNSSLSFALDAVYSANTDWDNYIPSNLLAAIQSSVGGGGGDGSYANLQEYITANGITRGDYVNLMKSLTELSPADGGGGFMAISYDSNFDGEIGSADLLDFLIQYGSTVDELGSASENWENINHPYFPYN